MFILNFYDSLMKLDLYPIPGDMMEIGQGLVPSMWWLKNQACTDTFLGFLLLHADIFHQVVSQHCSANILLSFNQLHYWLPIMSALQVLNLLHFNTISDLISPFHFLLHTHTYTVINKYSYLPSLHHYLAPTLSLPQAPWS